MYRGVAFFDIDGTVFRSSLLIEQVRYCVAEGLFPPEARNIYQPLERAWHERTGTYEHYIKAVIDAFMSHIRGISYTDFVAINKKIVQDKRHHVYRFTRELLKELKEDDYFLVAISQSPKGILDDFCEGLGFHKVYGRLYELGPSDRFTGKIIDEHLISNKANIVRRVIEKNDLTLAHSIAVGDTDGDVPMLEQVKMPICFNPNEALYRQAKRNQWRVMVERKDVIYEIRG